MRAILRMAILSSLLFCNFYAFADSDFRYQQAHSDSGISRRPLTVIHQEFASLAASQSHRADWIQYGTSVNGKPLMVLKVLDKNLTSTFGKKRPAILISEAIHGNEYLHITDRLPFEFLRAGGSPSTFEHFLAAGGVVYFVPIMNPDGYASGQRENARGADLNRDFTIRAAGNNAFKQPETRFITQYLASETAHQNLSVEATMEYHCCIGGLIHPWAWTSDPLTGETLERHQNVGEIMQSLFGYPYGTVSDILGYSAVGGSDDYYLETYGRRAFSFEGSRSAEDKKLQLHVTMWNRILEQLLESR